MSFDGSGVSSKDTRVVCCSFSDLGCLICPLLAVILLPLLPLVIAARISVTLHFMLLDTGTVIDDRREVYGVVVIGYQTLLCCFIIIIDRVLNCFSSDIEKT